MTQPVFGNILCICFLHLTVMVILYQTVCYAISFNPSFKPENNIFWSKTPLTNKLSFVPKHCPFQLFERGTTGLNVIFTDFLHSSFYFFCWINFIRLVLFQRFGILFIVTILRLTCWAVSTFLYRKKNVEFEIQHFILESRVCTCP